MGVWYFLYTCVCFHTRTHSYPPFIPFSRPFCFTGTHAFVQYVSLRLSFPAFFLPSTHKVTHLFIHSFSPSTHATSPAFIPLTEALPFLCTSFPSSAFIHYLLLEVSLSPPFLPFFTVYFSALSTLREDSSLYKIVMYFCFLSFLFTFTKSRRKLC